MITPLLENPAIVDPRRNLTRAEQSALASIDFFRHQAVVNGKACVGNKRFDFSTIRRLQDKELVRGRVPNLILTTGGGLALYRLKGGDA